MVSLDTKLTMLLRELIQHEVNVITDSDWFQEKINEAVDNKFSYIINEGHLLKEEDIYVQEKVYNPRRIFYILDYYTRTYTVDHGSQDYKQPIHPRGNTIILYQTVKKKK